MKVTYGNHYYTPLCIMAGRSKFPELLDYLKDLIEDLVTSRNLTADEAASPRVIYCLSYCYLAASLCVSKSYFNALRTFNTVAPAARYNGRVPAIRYLAGEKSIDAAQNTHLFARSRVIALITEFKKTGKFYTSYSSVIGHYHGDKTRYRHSVNGEDSCCTVM